MEDLIINSAGVEDEPEEGEIVSDDLEDISDDSIIFTLCHGKSLSRRDQLQALSLSSISDSPENATKEPRKRRKYIHRRHARHHKRTKRKSMDSESSDEGDAVSTSFKDKLKAAVRLDAAEVRKNSLKSLLFPTISLLEDESVDEAPSPQSIPPTDEVDVELRELRLEALKTALNNKFGKKRRKKDENKENTDQNVEGIQPGKVCEEEMQVDGNMQLCSTPVTRNETENVLPNSPDEDEDVLRAILLASMSKKITSVDSEHDVCKPKVALPNNKNITLNKDTNGDNNNKNTCSLPKLTVKPLIIKLDTDSDSDTDCFNSPEKGSPPDSINSQSIESSVDKFLREQRAQVENSVKKNVNGELNSKTEERKSMSKGPLARKIMKTALNNQKTPLKKTLPSFKNTKPATLDVSLLKLLPASKQKEYKDLILKLRTAELAVQPRVRRLSRKAADSNNTNTIKHATIKDNKTTCTLGNPNSKVVINTLSKIPPSKVNSGELGVVSSVTKTNSKNQPIKNAILQSPGRKSDTVLLQNTLKAMQVRKDGRLQIQDKYRLLRPLIKKINDASKEKNHWNQQVKSLLEQLAAAKKKQEESQKNLTNSIKDLVLKKIKIDRSMASQTAERVMTSAQTCQIKQPLKQASTEKNTIQNLNLNSANRNNIQKKNAVNIANAKVNNVKGSNATKQEPINEQPTTVRTGSDGAKALVNICDPNDVGDIIKESKEQLAKPKNYQEVIKKIKYESVLGCLKRQQSFDPYIELCPFEVRGTCKDAECKYNHLPK